MVFVYSTLSADTAYAVYALNNSKDLAIIERSILIRGGANVRDLHDVITPRGKVTKISQADYEILQKDYHFQQHVKNGFISVENKDTSIDRVVEDMEAKDASAPITPDDSGFANGTTAETESTKEKSSNNKKRRQ